MKALLDGPRQCLFSILRRHLEEKAYLTLYLSVTHLKSLVKGNFRRGPNLNPTNWDYPPNFLQSSATLAPSFRAVSAAFSSGAATDAAP
jgi:hypothetical protein